MQFLAGKIKNAEAEPLHDCGANFEKTMCGNNYVPHGLCPCGSFFLDLRCAKAEPLHDIVGRIFEN